MKRSILITYGRMIDMENDFLEVVWTNRNGKRKYSNVKAFFIDFLKQHYQDLKNEILKDYEYKKILQVTMEEATWSSMQEEWRQIQNEWQRMDEGMWGKKPKQEQ